jgi:hypothetical protein
MHAEEPGDLIQRRRVHAGAGGAEREGEGAGARGPAAAAGREAAEARRREGERERREERAQVGRAPGALPRRGEERAEGHEQRAEAAGRVEEGGRCRCDLACVEERPAEVRAERTEAERDDEARRGLAPRERRARAGECEGEGADEGRGLERGCGAHAARPDGANPRASDVATT